MFKHTPTFLVVLLLSLPLSGFGSLSISEFLAMNGGRDPDKDGDHSDWIEIHNSGETDVDLEGWHLTDDPDNLSKWKLPQRSVSPGAYTIIHASGKDFSSLFNPEIHANFSLSGNGEYLALVEPDGTTIAHEFAPTYPDQERDVTYGVAEDGETFGYFPAPTPGEANGAPSEGLVGSVK
ncbi:MAG: lamin tail domain-containing protein, partial [Verrucomicrobiales bacterium]